MKCIRLTEWKTALSAGQRRASLKDRLKVLFVFAVRYPQNSGRLDTFSVYPFCVGKQYQRRFC